MKQRSHSWPEFGADKDKTDQLIADTEILRCQSVRENKEDRYAGIFTITYTDTAEREISVIPCLLEADNQTNADENIADNRDNTRISNNNSPGLFKGKLTVERKQSDPIAIPNGNQ